MKLSDLIDLFVERDENPPRPDDMSYESERREDTSSLADIARILRQLDGHYDHDHR